MRFRIIAIIFLGMHVHVDAYTLVVIYVILCISHYSVTLEVLIRFIPFPECTEDLVAILSLVLV